MTYHQKKNKNDISIDITDTGILYKIKDETVSRKEEIPFEQVLNDQYEFFESNKAYKNNAIYGMAVGILFLLINLIYGTKLWAGIFLLVSPIFFYLYYRSKAAFTVIKTGSDINLFILQDKQHQEILQNIYKKRKAYLIDQYLEINYDNDPQAERNKYDWLKKQGIITDREFQVIHEEIEKTRS